MSRHVDADALLTALYDADAISARGAKIIREFPAAEEKHGQWKKSYADHEAFGVRPFFRYCSECHEATVHQYNYCPNCGAKMKGGQKPPKEDERGRT